MKDDSNSIALRCIANAIATRMAPEVNSALAKDATKFGGGLLRGMLLEAQAKPLLADYETALHTSLGGKTVRGDVGAWVERQYLRAFETGGEAAADMKQSLAAIAGAETHLQQAIRAADAAENQHAQEAAAAAEESLNAASLAAYLNRRLQRSDVEVVNLKPIPGGASKITCFVSLKPVPGMPTELVLRQDYAVNHVGNSVVDEYPFLTALHGAGLPIPTPLLLEAAPSALGAPFMLVHKVPGQNIGDLWGFFPNAEPKPVCIELARILAKLHSLRFDTLQGLDGGGDVSLRDRVLRQIEEIHGKWTRGRGKVSPVIALSLLWLVEHLDTENAAPALVHGDFAFTNILVHEGRVSALLDWEFAHIGDPAEDLAYIKSVIEQAMAWQEFIDAYCAAGGKTPSAARLRYFDVWRAARNSVYADLAGEVFRNGTNPNLMLGWAGSYALPLLEFQLLTMIGDSWSSTTA